MYERSFKERRALMQRIAALLYRRGARSVWLFGSLAQGRTQDRESDIDLAVEGLSAGDCARAAREAAAFARCRVDVIPLDTASPSLRWGMMRDKELVARPEPGALLAQAMRPAAAGDFAAALPTTAGRVLSLHQTRIAAAAGAIRATGARSVLDLGCGEGWLLEALAADDQFIRLTGVDLSQEALAAARDRLARALPAQWLARVHLTQGLITCREAYFTGHDAAAALEVIEHLDPAPREAFESVVFRFASPAVVVVTTPNAEYNLRWRAAQGERRHPDHRFEWTRSEFADWARSVRCRYGYAVELAPIGTCHPEYGPPSQMAVFTR